MKHKPRILVISYNFPRPDKSSGELRFVSILEMLSDFWDLDFCIANSHVDWNTSQECEPYIKKLEGIGIRVIRPAKDAFSNAVRDHDYAGAYFNLFRIAEEMMPLFRLARPAAFTIVDSVDVHYAREQTQARLGAVEFRQVEETRQRELGVYRSADAVIAVSSDDHELLTKTEGLDNVFLIPNIVREYPRAEKKREPVVIFIGCYAWYPNPEAVLWFTDLIWPAVREKIPDARFLVIGSDPTPEVLALGNVPGVSVLGYVPETKPYLDKAAVSVAPLRVGGGMKGKVNEAMAHGIPVVATSIGAQGFDIVHGKDMMVADDPGEFATCVIRLLDDEILQREMGLAGQRLNSSICSHGAVREKIREVAYHCNNLAVRKRKRTFIHHGGAMMAKGSLFFRDIGYAMQLLRRDGIGEFIRRTGMYFQGQRLPSIPLPGATEFITGYSLERPCGILEFPDPGEFPLVSVIIPVYNQWEYTFSCLGSILKNSDDIHYEIILVDDNSTDETRFAGQHVNNIRIIRNVVNQGFLFNCNKAAAEAGGKFIVLLNNDTLVQPGWLIWFLKTMEEHPDAGLAGAKLIFSTGRLQEAGGIVFRDGSAMNYGREDFPDRPQYNYFKDVDYCSGAAICVRKSLWDQLGGFDARYAPAYYEDTDLAMRIRGMGYRTVYQPKSVVIHFEGVSHGTDITQGIKKKQDDNQKIFYSRWRDELLKNHYNRDENIFRSRERSINRNIALLVGYKVPDCTEFPGKDRSLQMINSFIERDYVIKFLPIDFMRNEPHVTFLEQKGVEVLYGKWYHDNLHAWINENSANIDLVCFVDKKLAKSYANLFNADLKGNLNTVVFDRNFSFRARSVNSVL